MGPLQTRWSPKGDCGSPQKRVIKVFDMASYKNDLGKWTDWAFHIKWAVDNTGLTVAYKNGKEVFRRKGPNVYDDTQRRHFKLGLYKSEWQNKNSGSTTKSRTVWIDEVRMGDETASLSDVSPLAS